MDVNKVTHAASNLLPSKPNIQAIVFRLVIFQSMEGT
jgi:hypothetical protein